MTLGDDNKKVTRWTLQLLPVDWNSLHALCTSAASLCSRRLSLVCRPGAGSSHGPRGALCDHQQTVEAMACPFWDRCSVSLSQVTCSVGSQRPCHQGTQAHGGEEQRPANNHVSELGSGFSSPSWAWSWWQPRQTAWLQLPERPWARTIQLSSQIPDPQKLWEIIDVCSFTLLNFGVICSTARGQMVFQHPSLLCCQSLKPRAGHKAGADTGVLSMNSAWRRTLSLHREAWLQCLTFKNTRQRIRFCLNDSELWAGVTTVCSSQSSAAGRWGRLR